MMVLKFTYQELMSAIKQDYEDFRLAYEADRLAAFLGVKIKRPERSPDPALLVEAEPELQLQYETVVSVEECSEETVKLKEDEAATTRQATLVFTTPDPTTECRALVVTSPRLARLESPRLQFAETVSLGETSHQPAPQLPLDPWPPAETVHCSEATAVLCRAACLAVSVQQAEQSLQWAVEVKGSGAELVWLLVVPLSLALPPRGERARLTAERKQQRSACASVRYPVPTLRAEPARPPREPEPLNLKPRPGGGEECRPRTGKMSHQVSLLLQYQGLYT